MSDGRLTIVTGLAGTGKTTYCLKEVAALCKAEPFGAPLYIIVPEQASFEVEKQLAAECGGGFIRAQVSGFKRLAYKLLLDAGKARRSISDTARQIIIRRLIQQRKGDLSAFGNIVERTSFACEAAALFREFKNDAFLPEELSRAAATEKLRDLALLYADWEQYKADCGIMDPEDYLDELSGLLDMPQLRGARFWFDGFSFFSGCEQRFIAGLIEKGYAVTVTLCLDDPAADYADAGEMLHRPWRTFQKIAACRTPEVVRLEKSWRYKSAAIAAAGEILRGKFNAADKAVFAGGGFAVMEAANKNDECQGLVRQIVNLARSGGYRWRDIALAGAAVEEYRTILTAALEAAGVPYAYDTPQALSRHILNDFVRAALEVCTTNFSYQAVFQALKTGLAGEIAQEDTDLLENYCLRYGIRGWYWRSKRVWDFAGREQQFAGADEPLFDDAVINGLREQVVQLFAPLTDCGAKARLADYIAALRQILDAAGVAAALEKFSEARDDELDRALAAAHSMAWSNLQKLFDELESLCGEDILPLEDFARLLTTGLESSLNKLPPPGLDYVSVCSLERMKMPERRCLLVFGVNDGLVPAAGGGCKLLADNDVEVLNKHGIEYSRQDERLFAGRLMFYSAIMQAREKLVISFSASDSAGKIKSPSIFVNQLLTKSGLQRDVMESYAGKRLRVDSSELAAPEYLLNWRVAESVLASVYAMKLPAGADEGWWQAVRAKLEQEPGGFMQRAAQFRRLPQRISIEQARELFVKNGCLSASISKLEAFMSCPFRFFAAYGLKLKPRAEQEVNPLDIGNIYHRMLETIGAQLAQLDDDGLAGLCRQVFEQEKQKFKSDYFSMSAYNSHYAGRLYQRFEKAVLRFAAFNRNSGASPERFEQSFGRGGGWQPLMWDDGTTLVQLNGIIDRIDRLQSGGREQLLLIDYKQRGKSIDWGKLYYGLALQLPVYVAALKNSRPDDGLAGVLYLGLDDDRVTVSENATVEKIAKEAAGKVRFQGLMTADGIAASGLELPKDNVCSEEELLAMPEHARTAVADAAERISAGEIAAAPRSADAVSPCGYCDYQEMCQFERTLGDRCIRLSKIKREDYFGER